MKKIFKIILSYLLITFNSYVLAVENNNENILKIGILAPFSGEFKSIGETILYSVNLALHDIGDDSIKIYPKDSGSDKKKIIRAGKKFHEEGIKIVIVTHEMRTVYDVADRVLLLHEGRIQYDGSPDAINNVDDPVVQQFITGNSTLI